MGLSFRTDSRAVPRVCDWDPQPRATQKVSVCVLSGGGGKGQGQGVVSHGPWPGQILGVTLVKVGTLPGVGFTRGGKRSTGAVPGNGPAYHGCVQASRRCPGTRVTLGAEELWGLVALGHPVGTGWSGWGSERQGQETIRCSVSVVPGRRAPITAPLWRGWGTAAAHVRGLT